MEEKTFKQLYKEYFFDSLKWQVPMLLLIFAFGAWKGWPIDIDDFLDSGHSLWFMLFVVFCVPFAEGFVQGYYVWLMQQKPGYLERQQKNKEAADKWKADMAAKRAKYGRWWWLRRHKK